MAVTMAALTRWLQVRHARLRNAWHFPCRPGRIDRDEPHFRREKHAANLRPLSLLLSPSGLENGAAPEWARGAGLAVRWACNLHEIISVTRFPVPACVLDQEMAIDEALIISNFFWARNLQTLAPFQNLDVFGSLEEAVGGSRIKPRESAAHDLNGELPAFHIHAINVGDFKFAACRWLQ